MEVLPVWKVLLHWSLCDGVHFSVWPLLLCMNNMIVSSPHQIRMWFQMKCRICVSRDKSSYIPGTNFIPATPLIIISSVTSLDDLMKILYVCVWGWKMTSSAEWTGSGWVIAGWRCVLFHCHLTAQQCPPNTPSTQRWMLSTVTPSNCQPRGECHFVYVGLCTIQNAFKFQLCQ